MNIQGLDYNTQREKLVLPEYGREIQKMVNYCMTLPDRDARLRCAYAIIDTMEQMNPQLTQIDNYKQKLWNQLALRSHNRSSMRRARYRCATMASWSLSFSAS